MNQPLLFDYFPFDRQLPRAHRAQSEARFL